MSNSDTRESKFELLRIVSLFLVITTHVVSKWWWNIGYVHYNWHLSVLIGSFTRVAVGSFIMISGYFMYNRPFYLKKRVKQILLPFLFYLVIFILIDICQCVQLGKSSLDIIISLINFLLKVINDSSQYGHLWYIYTLLLFYLFLPYINILIDSLDNSKFIIFFSLLLIIFVILPSINYFVGYPIIRTEYSMNSSASRLGIFMVYYVMGAFISRFKILIPKMYTIMIYSCISTLIYISTAFFSNQNPFLHVLNNLGILSTIPEPVFTHNFFYYDNILVFTSTVAFFLIFNSIHVRNKYINYAGSLTYGAYLVHFVFILALLKTKFVNNVAFWYTPKLIPMSFAFILFIFILSLTLEAIRKILSRSILIFYEQHKNND